MSTRWPTGMPTGTPSAGPTHSPVPFVPEPIEAEFDFSNMSTHMILILISCIFACIFLAYLSVHLARKYHPEWFRRKKKTKEKGKNTTKSINKIKRQGEEKDVGKGKVLSSKQLMSIAPDPQIQDKAITKAEMGELEPKQQISELLGS